MLVDTQAYACPCPCMLIHAFSFPAWVWHALTLKPVACRADHPVCHLQFIAVGLCIGVYYFATFCSKHIWEVAEYCDCLGLDRTDEKVLASQQYLERLKWRCGLFPKLCHRAFIAGQSMRR